MKTRLWIGGVVAMVAVSAMAQVEVRTQFRQKQYLSCAPLSFDVVITNNLARPITLENSETQPWLAIEVMDTKGHPIAARVKAPQFKNLTIPAGETLGRRIDVQPIYYVQRSGRYKIQAAVILEGRRYTSGRTEVEVGNGRSAWKRTIALMPEPAETKPTKKDTVAAAAPPKDILRTLQLLRFSDENGQQLYYKMSDDQLEITYRCYTLGPTVASVEPQTLLQPTGELYVLHQASPENYFFTVIDSDGVPQLAENYTAVQSRPRLARDTFGNVVVIGGEKVIQDEASPAASK